MVAAWWCVILPIQGSIHITKAPFLIESGCDHKHTSFSGGSSRISCQTLHTLLAYAACIGQNISYRTIYWSIGSSGGLIFAQQPFKWLMLSCIPINNDDPNEMPSRICYEPPRYPVSPPCLGVVAQRCSPNYGKR
jgi:hypothetical protein